MNFGTEKGYHKGSHGSTKASKAWEEKKKKMRRNLSSSMNAAYKRGNKKLGDARRVQLTKLK